MLVNAFAWLRGYVLTEITGESPERFMNLCVFHQKDIWGFRATEKGLTARVKIHEYKSIRKLARRTGCRLHILSKRGLPFLLRRYRNRWGLVAGVLVFALMLSLLSSRLWLIEIQGTKTLPKETVLSILEENGICAGMGKNECDWATVRQSILEKHPDIAWMSMNPDGGVLRVDISETTKAPDLPDDTLPSHLKAACDGRIVEILAQVGQPMVQVGDGVVKGDILISGAVEYANGCTVFRQARGSVRAETVHKQTFTVPLQQTQMVASGQYDRRRVLHCFGFKIPLYLGSVKGNYEKQQQDTWLTVQGVPLPIGVTTATFTHLQPQTVCYTQQQAQALALSMAEAFAAENLAQSEITDMTYQGEVKEGKFMLNVKYFCVEEITFEEKMLIFQ